MKQEKRLSVFAIALLLTSTVLAPPAMAIPHGISYQAFLTDADGVAIDADVTITFAVYNVDTGGVPLWSQTESVEVDQGLLAVTLANPVNPFPPGLFDGPLYIGMFVAGEEMLPRREWTSAAFSYKASDADTLNGVQASTLDESAEVATLQGDVTVLDTRVTAIESMEQVQISGGGATSVSGSYPAFTISSTDNVNDADASTANEIQSLSLSGNTLSMSLGGGSVSLASFVSRWNNSGSNMYFNTGKVGIGDNSPVATLTIGNGDKLQVHGSDGDLVFNDDQGSIRFANSNGSNAAMIYMFENGTGNDPRMLFAHSSAHPDWGLQYDDSEDAFNWIGQGLPVMHIDLDDSRRVGLGTFTPEARLHVVENSALGVGQLKLTESEADYTRITFDNTVSADFWDVAARANDNLANADLNFYHSVGGNILSLDGRGRVGINDAAPGYALEINGNGGSRSVNVYNTLPTTTGSPTSYGVISVLSQAANTGSPRLYNVYGSSSDSDAATIFGVFGRAVNATSANYGVYGVASSVPNSYAVYASGNMYATGLYLPSDAKLKTAARSYREGLASVMKLRPQMYTYDTRQYDFMNLPEGQQYGFLAQEVEELFPDLIKPSFHSFEETDSGIPEEQGLSFKAINYVGLIPVIVSAMQEQQQVIEDQEEVIQSLETRLAALEAIISKK